MYVYVCVVIQDCGIDERECGSVFTGYDVGTYPRIYNL